LNARQKRLFEDALKKNPNLKMPTEGPPPELTEDDLALLKQGVGDKSGRPQLSADGSAEGEEGEAQPHRGAIMTYFEEKGFGFLRPENGGKDIFFHVSRLQQAQPTDLVPGTKVLFELGMDRNGKIAASALWIAPPEEPPAA
jgi:CspA family cold shock protein